VTSFPELDSRRRTEPTTARAIRWPRPGVAELVEAAAPPSGADHGVTIDVLVTVISSGTERARYLDLPNASVPFPHHPGYMAAGVVVDGAATVPEGRLVAARHVGHQSIAVVPDRHLHLIPSGVGMIDAALWHVGVTALHGLERGSYQPGDPLAVVGSGLFGTLVRRLAIAQGSMSCLVVARSATKRWTVAGEIGSRFVLDDSPELVAERGRHSLVVDATGTAEGLTTAVQLAAPGARVVLLGSPRAALAEFPLAQVHGRGLRVVGAHVNAMHAAATLSGVDLEARLTERFFALASAGASFADVVALHRPEAAPAVYRQLARCGPTVGLAFDWTNGAHDLDRAPR
jgi:NADPH:quinone reductase-like Zn-dependent oxidoreductase